MSLIVLHKQLTLVNVDDVPFKIIPLESHICFPLKTSSFLLFGNPFVRLRLFPIPWKTVKIIPMLNSNKIPKNSTSHTSVSILNSISKLLEQLIWSQINHQLDTNNLLNPHQLGYRKKSLKHSEARQSHRLHPNQPIFNRGALIVIVFLDLKRPSRHTS